MMVTNFTNFRLHSFIDALDEFYQEKASSSWDLPAYVNNFSEFRVLFCEFNN